MARFRGFAMTGEATGRIGFGTGHLYAGRARTGAVALVRAAIDAGISWIDTAPLYGHGAAEGIVGEAIAGQRDSLTLVSKVGILPSRLNLAYKLHVRLAKLAGKLPAGRTILPPPPERHPQFHVFAPAAVRFSVERSLAALRTDRIDWLLLHECEPDEAAQAELLDLLDRLVSEGKILGYGTATQRDSTAQIAASTQGARFGLMQVPALAPASPPDRFTPMPGQGIVLHSVLAANLKSVLARLQTDPGLRATAMHLGIDPDQSDLARRLIAHAARQPGVRTVLFSTSDAARLADTAQALSLSPKDADAGAQLMMAGDA